MAEPNKNPNGNVPNSTQFPNILLDELMPVVTPALWKLVSCVCRQTYGWDDGNGGRKKWDAISVRQAVKKTGLSLRFVIDGFELLTSAGVLIKGEVGKYGQEYSLNLKFEVEKAMELLAPKERMPRRKTGGSKRKTSANTGDEQSALGAELGSAPCPAPEMPSTAEPRSALVLNPDQQASAEPSSAPLLNLDQPAAEAGSAEMLNPVQQQNKLSKETNQKKLSKGEEAAPQSACAKRPAPFPSALKGFMNRIGANWQQAQARMQTDNPRATLFLQVRMSAKMEGMEYEQAKQFLTDHPGWKEWPDLKDLDSQQEIVFPEPEKSDANTEADYVFSLKGDISTRAQQLFQSWREFMRERLDGRAYQQLIIPLRFCCMTETELHVMCSNAEFAGNLETRFRGEIREWLPQQLQAIRFVSPASLKVTA